MLTDFGTRDGYVGAMKGVMAGLLPTARIDDIAHDIPQGSVGDASWALSRYWRLYPPGTVHLVVVDPGVGTDRRALAVEVDGLFVVAPDNGVVGRVLDQAETWRAVALKAVDDGHVSRTFHGRDLFAPAAARLASGLPLEQIGAAVDDPIVIREPAPSLERGVIRGRIVAVDHFGNLISNISAAHLRQVGVPENGRAAEKGSDDEGRHGSVEVAGRGIPLVGTYGEVDEGALVALVNSAGRLEIAVRNGSAARRLNASKGLPVRVLGTEP